MCVMGIVFGQQVEMSLILINLLGDNSVSSIQFIPSYPCGSHARFNNVLNTVANLVYHVLALPFSMFLQCFSMFLQSF